MTGTWRSGSRGPPGPVSRRTRPGSSWRRCPAGWSDRPVRGAERVGSPRSSGRRRKRRAGSCGSASSPGRAYIWDTPADQGPPRHADGPGLHRRSGRPMYGCPTRSCPPWARMVLGDEFHRYDIEAEGDRLAFATSSGSTHRSRRRRRRAAPPDPDPGAGEHPVAGEDARIRTMGSELSGSFGVVTGDTLYFANVNLRASPLDLELVRRLLPVDLPVEGLLIGTVEVDGPLSALRTRGDLRHRDVAHGGVESAVRWTGTWSAPALHWGCRGWTRRSDGWTSPMWRPSCRSCGFAVWGADGSGWTGRLSGGSTSTGELSLDQSGSRSTIRGAAVPVRERQLFAGRAFRRGAGSPVPPVAAVPVADARRGPRQLVPSDLPGR
jgi:hypothetical protein